MNPYPEYYSVDFDYVNHLPKGWKLLPNIAIFEERIQKGYSNEELLSVTIKKGIIRQSEFEEKKDSSNEDKSSYKLVKPGDIAYNKMRMWQGALGYSKYCGLVSPAYIVLKPKMEINSKFFHYQYRSAFYISYSRRASYGICDDMLSLRYIDFKRMLSIVPPIETQCQIVEYLEQKEKMMDEYFHKKQRIVELTLQQIFAIIFQSKNSNSELSWIQLFPAIWKIEKAKWIFTERNTKNRPEERLIAVTQHKGVVFKDEIEENYVSPSEYTNLKLVCENDFVLSLRSFEGGIEFSRIQGIVSPAYNIFYLREEYDNVENRIFYNYLFKTKQFIGLLNTIISGIRDGKNINYKDFRNLLIPLPDKETVKRVSILHEKYIRSRNLITKEVEAISKYFESCISHLVLGKRQYESHESFAIAAEPVIEFIKR